MNRPRPGLPLRGKPAPLGRSVRPQAATTNPMPLIVGGIAIVLIVILFVVMSGSKKEPAPAAAPPPPPAAPKPVDVSTLEREGHKYCEEGLALIQAQEANFSRELNEAGRTRLKEDLRKGIDLIQKGMSYLSEANEKSGRQYQTTRYVEARKLAAMKYGELR